MKIFLAFEPPASEAIANTILPILEDALRESGHENGPPDPDSTAIKVECIITTFSHGNSFEKVTYKCEIFITIIALLHGERELQAACQMEYPSPSIPRGDILNRNSVAKKCAKLAAMKIVEELAGF